MLYFQHETDARESEEIVALISKYKSDGYSIYFISLEFLGKDNSFFKQKEYSFEFIKRKFSDMGIEFKKMQEIYGYLFDKRLLWGEQKKECFLMACPQLTKRSDQYTQKQLRKGKVDVADKLPAFVQDIFDKVCKTADKVRTPYGQGTDTEQTQDGQSTDGVRKEGRGKEGKGREGRGGDSADKFPPEFLLFLANMKSTFKTSKAGKEAKGDLVILPLEKKDLFEIWESQDNKDNCKHAWHRYVNVLAEQWEEIPTVKEFKKKFVNIIQK